MSLILSLESTTNVCSVAIHNDGNLVALKEHFASQSHSRLLALYISDILEESNLQISELDAVAVSKGPGSYTGIRIGVSTAKGLCYALSKPLIAVDTLQAMAYGVRKFFLLEDVILCPMIDARRMEVYTMAMNTSAAILMKTTPIVIDEDSFSTYLSEHTVLFFGNGAGKCKNVIKHTNAHFIDNVETSAVQVGQIATEYFALNKFEDVAYFEPSYLKEFRVGKPK